MTDTKKWEDLLELLLMDILLKSENPVKRYPLGQLKKRVGDFIQDLLLQTQMETLEWCEREVVGDYEQGYNNPNGKHRSGESAEQMVINMFKAEQHQTIKNKIKSLEEK